MDELERFRDMIEKALEGRAPTTMAEAAGLPRNKIRNVLLGYDPRLTHAIEIARLLNITFVIGSSQVPPSELIEENLCLAIEAAEDGLQIINCTMTGAQKAQLIIAIYKLISSEKSEKLEKENDIIKLIQSTK